MDINLVEIVADSVYRTATDSDMSPDKRRRRVAFVLDRLVQEVAVAQYQSGRADGAIGALRALGGFDDSINELAVAVQKDAD
jgi:hypothetical protein